MSANIFLQGQIVNILSFVGKKSKLRMWYWHLSEEIKLEVWNKVIIAEEIVVIMAKNQIGFRIY